MGVRSVIGASRTWLAYGLCGAALVASGCGDEGGGGGTGPVSRAWTAPLDFGGGCVSAGAAIDAAGNAIVSYIDEATMENCLARYRPAHGDWGTVETVNVPASEPVGRLAVGMDDAGNAFALWPQAGTVYANRRTGGSWKTPTPLHTDTDTVYWIALTVAGDGRAEAAWVRGGMMADFTVKASIYSPGAGWSAVEPLGSGTDEPSMITAHVAMDSRGRAYVAWTQAPMVMEDTGTRFARYSPAAGWSVETVLIPMGGPYMAAPRNLVASPDGKLMNGWIRYYDYGTGEEYRVWTQLYDPETGLWADSEFLGIVPPPTQDIRDLHVSAGTGNRFATVWVRNHSTSRPEVIMTVRPDDPWGWRGIKGVETEKAPVYPKSPKIGMDSAGNLLVVWWHETGGGAGEVRSRRWVEGEGFEDQETVSTGSFVNRLVFDSNASGAAVVVWDNNTTRQIQASVYE